MAVDVDDGVGQRRTSRADGREREEFDLGTLMTHYETVREQLWPLYWLLVEIKRLRRWESYPLSLSAVTLTSLALLFPRALFAGVVGVLLMVVVGGSQYLWPFGAGQRSRIVSRLSPPLIDEDAEISEENLRAEKKRRKQLENYKKVIRKADELLVGLSYLLEDIKNIIKWTNRKRSLFACLILLVIGGATVRYSVSTILTALYISIFCCNSYFITRTKQVLMKFKNLIQGNKIARQLSHHQLPRPIAAISQLTRNDNTASSTVSAIVDDLNSSNDSVTAETERGGVSTRDKGSCSSCKANFTILKRKHPCSNCGHFFCSSCTVKVQKSLLGATSPAAFQQTVRVCLECKEKLPQNTHDTI